MHTAESDTSEGASLSNGIPAGALPKIRANLGSLAPAEQQVARFFLAQPAATVRAPVKRLASEIGVADATVIRTAQNLGFSGLRELKLALAAELTAPLQELHEEIDPGDDALAIARKVLRSDQQAIIDTETMLDGEALERAVAALVEASRIECYGVGSSLPVALDAAYRFLRIGLPAFAFVDPHMQAVSAGQLPPNAVALAISHTGRTKETLSAMEKAREAGATLVLITSHAHTPLGDLADVVLVTAARETALRTEAMASRIAHLSVVDALYVAVGMKRQAESLVAMARAHSVIEERRVGTGSGNHRGQPSGAKRGRSGSGS